MKHLDDISPEEANVIGAFYILIANKGDGADQVTPPILFIADALNVDIQLFAEFLSLHMREGGEYWADQAPNDEWKIFFQLTAPIIMARLQGGQIERVIDMVKEDGGG
jgi:hypothetical protein